MSTHSAAALPAANAPITISVSRRRIGRVVTALPVLFLLFDTALKLGNTAPAIAAMPQLGYPPELVLPIGLIELFCLILYIVSRTSVIGAVVLTGYLGGAIATHVRIGNPLFSHILFPIYIAALLWGGLYLRDARVRALVRSSNN
jgi:hypothetical protein